MKRTSENEKGAAMVEFALILPILLLVVFGIFSFGFGINYWIDMTHLTSEGARYASVNRNPGASQPTPQSLQQWLRQQADTQELRSGGSDAVPSPATLCIDFPGKTQATVVVGDPVRVRMAVNFNYIPIIGDAIGVGNVTIVGSATHRLEAKPTAYTASLTPCA